MKLLNVQCVDNGDVRTSCCYAMVLPYRPISKRSSGLYRYLLYGPHCFPTSLVDSRPPDSQTEAIPRDGMESDRDLLGSGSPSTGLKNRRRAVVLTDSVQIVYTCED